MNKHVSQFAACFFLSASTLLAQTAVAPASGVTATSATPARHLFFHVQLPKDHAAASGRLLVFVEPVAEAKKEAGPSGVVTSVELAEFHPTGAAVAARDVYYLAPGATVDIDTDDIAYPSGFSSLPAGDYDVQAVLDVNRDYNYAGRTAGDLLSGVATVHLDAHAVTPTLSLATTVPTRDPWKVQLPPGAPKEMQDRAAAMQTALDAARPNTELVEFRSPALSAFWGRDIFIKAWVLTPPGYKDSKDTYPTVYFTHGFGGTLNGLTSYVRMINDLMAHQQAPPMIWVFLDESSATGTHEFADGVNNGPWGQALTGEFIPYIESKYRMDARTSSRFLNGHSSGGWATLWLQTRYPKIFGGTWSTSPDPSDFHNFSGIDLYAKQANAYHRADGSLFPIMRDKGQVVGTLESFAKMEQVIGPYGGQLASFEWVFSPRGPGGRPEEMFNRATGDVDPAVVQYWHDHYDIAYLVKTNWSTLGPDLDGKIHLIVGTADTFYLDGAAHKLQSVLDDLHAKSDFRFLPDKTHFDLYTQGSDRFALFKTISWEMYAVARPGSKPPAAMVTAPKP
jgi:S-formylglutathione hydrolase FrmB